MRLKVTCNSCGTPFRVESRHAGRTGRCPRPECGASIRIPLAGAPSDAGVPAVSPAVVERPAGVGKPMPLAGRPMLAPHVSSRRTGVAPRRRPKGLMPYATVAGGLVAVAVALFLLDSLGGGKAGGSAVSGGGLLLTTAGAADVAAPVLAADDPDFQGKLVPFLTKYCADCHGPDYAEADVNFAAYPDVDSLRDARQKWNQIAGMIRIGAMPPNDHDPQPTPEERREVDAWLDRTLNHVDCELVDNPGRVTLRRLNRVEYDNTIRDLVGVDFEPAAEFPSDDVGNGFDNQGDVLSVPPLLIEKYLDAAEAITDKAIVAEPERLLAERKEGDLLASGGDVKRRFSFSEGEYLVRVGLSADQAGDEPAKSEIRFDGQPLAKVEVQGDRKSNAYDFVVKVDKAGEKRVSASFLNDYYDPKHPDPKRRDRNLYVEFFEVQGPKGGSPDLPESHRRLIFTRPGDGKTVRQAAEEVLTVFAARAFRRPLEPSEAEPYVRLVEMATDQGETFERGVAYAVQGILVSPQFLFRIEADPQAGEPGKRALGDYQLASRLSYFLWSSMPDAELLRLAAAGELHEPEVLRRQAERMLSDPKSQALVENFFGQWLGLRNLNEARPNERKFPQWNTQLREAMRKETELFCATIVKENRSVLDVLDGDFTFVNPRLAELYGIEWNGQNPTELYYAYDGPNKNDGDYRRGRERRPGYYKHENEFVRVSLPEGRRGVLTQASVLTLTSNPGDTSPVKRGKWILENVLGTPPPPAPPGVPAFDAAKKNKPDATLREQLALHRANPSCASCHDVMDPLGLGFENFDAVGRWRDKDGRSPIDASGTLEDGKTFNGAVELVGLLKRKDEQIARHVVEKLMTYGLGRGLEYYDRCAVDEVAASAAADGYRFSAVVAAIVQSEPFRLRRGAGGQR